MDLLAPIVDIIGFLLTPICRQIGYLKDLNHNMGALKRETDELRCIRDGVQTRVEDSVSSGKERLPIVQNWLQEAGGTIAEVDSIMSQMEGGRTRCCCVDLNSRRRLGKRVIGQIADVRQLRGKGHFSEVAQSPRREYCPQVPPELEQQRTSKEALEEISLYLKDEVVGVICVLGMGGIGKTTLVKEIYTRFKVTNDFQQVIWETVSKDLDLEDIQKKIGNKLGLQFQGDEGAEKKRDRLYARLRSVRYLLVLDDLWRKFPLDEVGIPRPNKENHCKILITTRLNQVSNSMEADRQIKIKPLGSEEAWNLFRSKTGDVIRSPTIKPLAEEVVKQCGGLPLALITVGGAMRQKDKERLWQHALTSLKGSAPEIEGMEREVFLPLKLSYDCLEDPKVQACFLYCSLYLEDHEIYVEELITSWAFEEGLVNNVNSLEDALNKGHYILEKLMDACLLEKGTQGNAYVRMHDLVRDLAIWITSPSSSSCLKASKFLVKAGEGIAQPPEEKIWEGVQRISLMNNQITELQMMPNCPDLVSLFLCNNRRLHTIGDSFFQLMPKLQVLNLGNTGIKSLPSSLSHLVNLRVLLVTSYNNLQEMPPLGDLKELQLLVLSWISIENFPQGITSLAKLKYLELLHTDALATIPGDIISRLTSLEHLSLVRETSLDTWREIAALPRLTSLRIQLNSFDASMENVFDHPIWSRLSRFLVYVGSRQAELVRAGWPRGTEWRLNRQFKRRVCINHCQDFPSQINSNSMMQNAEDLIVQESQGSESLSQRIGNSTSLRSILLDRVRGMKCAVDWRKAGVSNALDCLEELFVADLPCLEKVIHGGPHTGLQQLRKISIHSCPKLTFIFSSTDLQFLHQLEELVVSDCEEIEEIVKWGQLPDTTLGRLRFLVLGGLPKLTTICSQQLVLTSVERIEMDLCPELEKLPVLCSSILEMNGYIRASREWWEGIEWEDEHSKSLYSTIYTEMEESDEEASWK